MSDITAGHQPREVPRLLLEGALGAVFTFDARGGWTSEAPLDRAYHWIIATVCLYVAVALGLLQVANIRGPDLPSLTPLFVAGIFATKLSTSFLLFVLTRGARTWSLLMLGCAFLFGGLMSVFHLLTFPGGVLPDTIILGTDQSARWIYNLWHAGFGILALIAIVLEIGGGRIGAKQVDRAIALAIISVLAAIAATAAVAIVGVGRLPLLITGSSWTDLEMILIAVQLAVLIAGIGLVLGVLRARSLIFLLMSLVLTAMAFAQILSIAGPGRYTIGWTVGRLSWTLAACILFLFFMVQFARQQKLLMRSQEVLEARVTERTGDLTEAVKERDLLLRELHHRIKNKMQIVDAVLATEARYARDADARQGLQDVRSRVYVLALAHQHLMQSDFKTFDIAPFLQQLTENILANRKDSGFSVTLEAMPLMVTIDFAGPMGLLATELIIDCLDQSRPSGSGQITLTLQRNAADAAVLTVSDNRLAPEGPADSGTATQRTRVVRGLVGQLDGAMTERYNNGSHVEIVFPPERCRNEQIE